MRSRTVRIGVVQVYSAKARRVRRLRRLGPEQTQDHFRRYNIGAITYDETYCRDYGQEYLGYLDTWLERLSDQGVDLALLPEFIFMPGVWGQPGQGVEANPTAAADATRLYTWSGQVFTEWLQGWAERAGLLIGATAPMVRAGKIHNLGILVGKDGVVGEYAKVHLPLGEEDIYSPGDCFPVFETPVGRVAFSICYDIHYPECMLAYELQGAEIILHPSAGYSRPDEQRDMGHQRLRVRASDQFAVVAYACCTPEKAGQPRNSCVIDQTGRTMAKVSGKRSGIAIGDVMTGRLRAWPQDADPAIDRQIERTCRRRPDLYGKVLGR